MAVDMYPRIQKSLDEKLENVTEFLETASETEKEICLCESEGGVYTHLEVIETSLEKIEDQTLGICVICHEPVDSELLQMDYTASVCLGHFTEQELRQLKVSWNFRKLSSELYCRNACLILVGWSWLPSIVLLRSLVAITLTSFNSVMERMES